MRGGAWCPRSVIQAGVTEWLEVNLRAEYWLTASETQGRFGGGQGQEYTQHYQLQYWRDSLGRQNVIKGQGQEYTQHYQLRYWRDSLGRQNVVNGQGQEYTQHY